MRNTQFWHSTSYWIGLVMALVATLGFGYSQQLYWLGTLGGSESEASDISADGRVVVGSARNADGYWRAFVWTRSTGMTDIGTLGGNLANAYTVSADGAYVAGQSETAEGRLVAFRWNPSTGLQSLGTLGGASSLAISISADGSVVVGTSQSSTQKWRPFRWDRETGMEDFLTLDPNLFAEGRATGVSADGTRIVGYVVRTLVPSQIFAFYWTTTGEQELFDMWARRTFASGISPDGNVVVGSIHIGGGVACRWTRQSGLEILNFPGSTFSTASDASHNGRQIVGFSYTASTIPERAYRWREGVGGDDLNQTYASLLSPGSVLTMAVSTSWDGRYIVGRGYNAETGRYEGFLLDTWRFGDTNGDGCIDDADILLILSQFGQSCDACYADVTGDGSVDDGDLLTLLSLFGQGCN